MTFEMARFRAHLRAEREARIGSREKLATKIHVAQSTIQSAEVGPDIPGIDTVAKMIEALPGLTLAEFFAELERSRSSDLNSAAKSDDHGVTPQIPMVIPDADARAQLSDGVPQAILGLAGSLNDRFDATAAAIDRLADRLEQIAAPRRSKTLRRPRPSDRRKKVG